MTTKKIDQGTILILDIGKNVSVPEEKNEPSFFTKARECAVRIIERKIISQGKSLLGIILIGSKKTKNSMNDLTPGSCRHITMFTELQFPKWDMIRDLPEMPTEAKGNWFDSLLVAAEHFSNGLPSTKITHKKIILITNFQAPSKADNNQVKQAINGFQMEKFEIDVIGTDVFAEENNTPDMELARHLVEGTNGATATFDFTMRYLLFHKKKAVNSSVWNVDLSIGPNIKIPVSIYIRLKDEPVIPRWNKAIRDPVTNSASTTEGIIKEKVYINTENQTEVKVPIITKGYEYGQQVIPFSEHDKSMLYDSGQKSLTVYGFTKAKNITWQCLNGDALSYVFGRKDDKRAQYAIRCLVECMLELDLFAIVRRVYNNGTAAKMHVLMPVIDSNNFVCLSMVGICYKNEIKNMTFPATNLKIHACSEDQVNAFKALIKAMDLTKAYDASEFDDTEAFPIAKIVSPSAQYVLDCIAYRAMNPGKDLPKPRDDILMLFKVPPLIEKRSRDPIEKLRKLFSLNKVEIKTRGTKKIMDQSMDVDDDQLNQPSTSNNNEVHMDDIPKINLNILKQSDNVQKIGTINPIHDFDILLRNGGTLNNIASQMTEAIESMIYGNIGNNFDKAIESMKHFRSECLKTEPMLYNEWIKHFRMELTERKLSAVLNLINDKKVGYILKTENCLSTFTTDTCDDSQLYENDTVPTLTEVSISSEVKDLFDNM